MKCPYCDDGVSRYSAPGFRWPCTICEGTGKVLSNEEWLNNLPTEEKARWLYDHYVNARADEHYGRQEKTLSEYQKWLVSVHEKIDGTKID